MKIRSLTTKLLFPCIMLMVLSSLISYSISRNQLQKTILKSFKSKGQTLAKSMETGIQETLMEGTSSAVQAFIDEYRKLEGIAFIIVIDEHSKVAAHTFYPIVPAEYEKFTSGNANEYSVTIKNYDYIVDGEKHFIFEIPILAGLLGKVVLGMNYEKELNQALQALDIYYLFLYAGLMLTFTFLAIYIVLRVLRPISDLTRSAKSFQDINALETVDSDADGEVAELIDAYNKLVSFAKNYTTNLEDEVRNRSDIITQQQEQLANSARMSMLGEMTAGIAHEINNPLTVLNTGSMVLKKALQKKDVDKVQIEKIVDDNLKVIQRISKIVIGMRNISRDGSSDQFEKARLGEIFEDSLSILAQKMKNNKVELKCDLSNEVFKKTLVCRHVEISQVLVNLLGNAYDAVIGQTSPWIAVDCVEDSNNFIISITDSGPGIPEEIRERVFIPFFTTKPVGKGTGLGLSLCARIAANHGGTLRIDETNEFTCFVLTLSKKPAAKRGKV